MTKQRKMKPGATSYETALKAEMATRRQNVHQFPPADPVTLQRSARVLDLETKIHELDCFARLAQLAADAEDDESQTMLIGMIHNRSRELNEYFQNNAVVLMR
jgi:hypothetical protein